MRKIVFAATLAAIASSSLLLSQPSSAATEGQCHAAFAKMDAKGNGFIAGSRAAKYIKMMKSAKRTMADPKRISETEFMAACVEGAFKNSY